MRDDEYLSMIKSTIVRSESMPRSGLRAVGRSLSAVAPGLAARLAARLFLTPPRHRRPALEARELATGRPGLVEAGGRRLATWTWGHGPTVLLVHGWGGRGGQLLSFVPPLLGHGLAVTTFDAPGHGDSGERQVTLPDLVASLRAVAAAPGPVHGVIAHSLGAAATARALYEDLRADAAVFVGPPADMVTASFAFTDALGLDRRARELMQRRIERQVGLPWKAFDVTRLAGCQATPLLVIHDRDDAEIPWQQGAAVARAWPDARLLTTGGLGHRRILRDPTVVTAATAFVAAAGRRADDGRANDRALVAERGAAE